MSRACVDMQVLHWPLRVACHRVWRTLHHIRNDTHGCTPTFVAHTIPVWGMYAPIELTVRLIMLVPWYVSASPAPVCLDCCYFAAVLEGTCLVVVGVRVERWLLCE